MSCLPFKALLSGKKSSSSSMKSEEKRSNAQPSYAKPTVKKFSSYEEMKRSGFEVGKTLGGGGYCEVKSAQYRGADIAVKVINRKGNTKDFLKKFLPREIEILTRLNHEHIIKVFKVFNFPERVYIYMENAKKGDMLDFIRNNGCLIECEARYYFRQMVSAVKYMHSMHVAHRDLKCENIMINDRNEIKIIDFGFVRNTTDSTGEGTLSKTFCGSTVYASPQILQCIPYNPMLYDVWSLGCVLFIMVSGTIPFDDTNVRRMIRAQLQKEFRFPPNSNLGKAMKDLVKSMLEPDVEKRYTMYQVSKSAWLQEKDESDVSAAITGRENSEVEKVRSVSSNSSNSGFVKSYYYKNCCAKAGCKKKGKRGNKNNVKNTNQKGSKKAEEKDNKEEGKKVEKKGNKEEGKKVEKKDNKEEGKKVEKKDNKEEGKKVEKKDNKEEGKKVEKKDNKEEGKKVEKEDNKEEDKKVVKKDNKEVEKKDTKKSTNVCCPQL